jgi:hypothetical protein
MQDYKKGAAVSAFLLTDTAASTDWLNIIMSKEFV